MRTTKDIARFASLAAVLLAGSCAAPENDGTGPVTDPMANHPIAVEPAYRTIKVPFSAGEAGLMPDDAQRFDNFAAAYLATGNGAISITAPQGAGANAAIGYFAERLASLGVPRARILVGTGAAGDQVEIGFVSYSAHVENCVRGGDWSVDASGSADNSPMPNFGCSVQRNIAAMVADPRDLVDPRTAEDSDATRRQTVMGHYEKGEITQTDKHTNDKTTEQSGTSSEIQ